MQRAPYRLFMCCLLSFCSVSMGAHAQDKSETAVSETERKSLTAEQLEEYIRELSASGQVLSDLKVIAPREGILFDVKSVPNKAEDGWVVFLNLSRAAFRQKSDNLTRQGYVLQIERSVTRNRRKLYSGVWVQKKADGKPLIIPDGPMPEQGDLGRDLEPLNELVRQTLKSNNIPGATVVVSRDQNVIYRRAFGYADVDAKQPMPVDAVMRIASISKPVTAAAILLLVEDQQLTLNDKALDWLEKHPEHFRVAEAIAADARWKDITILHLLQHTAGFDRDLSKDTMFRVVEISHRAGLKQPARIPDIVRFQMQQKLDFDPGTRYAYSNVGYCLLGRIIEAASKLSYEEFVTKRILQPLGMSQTRLGFTPREKLAEDEVHYFTQQRQKTPSFRDLVLNTPPDSITLVETPYGQWDLEVMDAHGGWTSSAIDLVRFANAVGESKPTLLKQSSINLMSNRPEYQKNKPEATWYGLGWSFRNVGSTGHNMWHTGSLAGTSTLLVSRADGCSWCVLFNCDRASDQRRSSDVIDSPFHGAVNSALLLLAP